MTNAVTVESLALVMAAACAGVVFGLFYFAGLERTARLFAAGRGWLVPLALTLGRIAAAAIFLAAAAKLGAVFLLAAFAGFLLARSVMLHDARRAG